jgi:hypothetical protein
MRQAVWALWAEHDKFPKFHARVILRKKSQNSSNFVGLFRANVPLVSLGAFYRSQRNRLFLGDIPSLTCRSVLWKVIDK